MAKKPKRPKTSASVHVWIRYDHKLSEWHRNKKKKEALIRKHRA